MIRGEVLEHGSIVFTVEGVIGQVIGIPRPPGLIPVIPKYVPCSEGDWRRPGSRYCRVLREYGPRGVKDALRELLMFDPIYATRIPMVHEYSTSLYITPRDALRRLASRGPPGRLMEAVYGIVHELRSAGIPIEDIGITGSLAAGISFEASDIDLVIYGVDNAVIAEEVFREIVEPLNRTKEEMAGFMAKGVSLGWRRGYKKGVMASWIGIPAGPYEICKPLNSYWRIESPRACIEVTVYVEPGQATALVYPPCVRSDSGYLVSFEYNIAQLLYKGGLFKVRGEAGEGGVIYLATEQCPGYIEPLAGRK